MRTGRPKKPLDMRKVAWLYYRGGWTLRQIGALFNVAHTTISRRLKSAQMEPSPSRQEVLIFRTPTCTKYLLVGKRMRIEHHG